jgi:hypothetical protein
MDVFICMVHVYMRTWINQVHTRLQAIHHSTNRDFGAAANSDHSPVTILSTSEGLELTTGVISVLMFIYVHACGVRPWMSCLVGLV